MDVEIQNYSRWHVNVLVRTNGDNHHWKFTGFYGHPEVVKRKDSWTLLRHLGTYDPMAWLSMGDYNETTEDVEKVGGSLKPKGQMVAFRETLDDCRLVDLGFNKPKFTMRNGQEGEDFIMERWDRAVANVEWKDMFPFHKVHILASRSSGHAPAILTFQKNSKQRRRRRGRFCYEMAGRSASRRGK
jgi:hypothetical protein